MLYIIIINVCFNIALFFFPFPPPPSLYLQSRVSIMKAATRKSPIAPVRSGLSIVGWLGLLYAYHVADHAVTVVMLRLHAIPLTL